MAPLQKTRSKTAQKSAQKAARIAAKVNRTKDQKLLQKNVMKSLVATVLEKEREIKQSQRERLPKNYLKDLISGFSNVIPMLTVKSLKNAVAYHKKKNMSIHSDVSTVEQTTTTDEPSELSPTNSTSSSDSKVKHAKQGRPKQEFLRKNKIEYSMAMNEVTQMTADLKQKEGVLTNESFQKIVMEVKNKRNLPDDFEIKKNTVTRRLQRKKIIVEPHECMGGLDSPLAEIEPSIVQIVLCMTKFRQSLTSREIMQLVNSAIEGTIHQEKLIAFKLRN
jgi:hypothetical protein